jgi:hypothetical protein
VARISLTNTMLRRIVKAVAPATAQRPEVPTHFSETMLVTPVTDGLRFTCTDGFRLHQVETFKGMVNYGGDGKMVFGIGWLQDILKETGRAERWMELSAEPHPDTAKFVEIWETRCTVAADEHSLTEHGQRFDIGGRWPNPESLIDYDTVEDSVGFNPTYFKHMIDAAMGWWDKDTPDAALPLLVKQMHPQKVSTFTIRNAIGRLTMTLMPKIMTSEEY